MKKHVLQTLFPFWLYEPGPGVCCYRGLHNGGPREHHGRGRVHRAEVGVPRQENRSRFDASYYVSIYDPHSNISFAKNNLRKCTLFVNT